MKITNLKLYFQLIVSWCEPIFREDSMRLTSKSQQCTNYNITGKLTDFTNKQNSKISKYYNNRLILAMLSGLASSYSSSMLDRAICLLSTSVSIRMSTRMSIRRLWWEWDLLVIWQWHRQEEVLLGLVFRLDREGNNRWVIIFRFVCSIFRNGWEDRIVEIVQKVGWFVTASGHYLSSPVQRLC